ncbi:MAG: hypothetical protein JRH20_08445 [Deltaproteobacteria bacterium]|nr:hypothetical protein [Deltaproteobacteria bacterium]
MNSRLLDKLKEFRCPAETEIPKEFLVVAQLTGIDFEGIFNSPEFEVENAFDARFGKMMVHTASHLLGGDACGLLGYTELTQLCLLLDHRAVSRRWTDPTDLQNYLVGLASAKMTLLLEEEALFICRLYAFPNAALVGGYFVWRQQEAYLNALNGYCRLVLGRKGSAEQADNLIAGLGPEEKEEILRQNDIDYESIPAWQRYGASVHLGTDGEVNIDTVLPTDVAFGEYATQYLAKVKTD